MINSDKFPELLYDPLSGKFFSLTLLERGYLDKSTGYYRVCYKGTKYRLHRLAWFFIYGEFPNKDIDHIDGDKCNNRLDNLREVSKQENKQNTRKPTLINKATNLLGTSEHRLKDSVKYRAQIRVNGKNKHLGLFNTPEEAYAAYLSAKRIYHKGNTL